MCKPADGCGGWMLGAGLRDQNFVTACLAVFAPHPGVAAFAVFPENVERLARLLSRHCASHNQNSSLSPNCMIRGFTLIAVIFPNVLGLETSLAGLAKFVQLKTLKTSQRNSMVALSPRQMSLMRAMSRLRWPGPLRTFLPKLPKIVPPPVTGNCPSINPPSGMNVAGTNASVSKYRSRRLLTLPCRTASSSVFPGARVPVVKYVAGPKSVPAALSRILNGSPDCRVTTPDNTHPPAILVNRCRWPAGSGSCQT